MFLFFWHLLFPRRVAKEPLLGVCKNVWLGQENYNNDNGTTQVYVQPHYTLHHSVRIHE